MRLFVTLSPCLLVTLSLLLIGCGTIPATPIAALSPEAQRVAQSTLWPNIPAKRPFSITIHIAGRRTTATGVLDYHDPRDFRITAATELGNVLFDVRVNWTGVTVLRTMPGIDASIVEAFVRNLSRAMTLPDSLEGLTLARDQLLLRRNGYLWTFDANTDRLKTTEITMGTFDTLRIEYLRYDHRGWPREIAITRRARFYSITLTFTDAESARLSARG